MSKYLYAAGLFVMSCGLGNCFSENKMFLVENGASRAQIVLAPDASPVTEQAAKELAGYVKKMSGAEMPVVKVGQSGPAPTNAIWVGLNPKLSEVYPKLKLNFEHPEEILLACDGRNLVIAGRDRMAGTNQVEYGTVNAVYTFLEKKLDVRWLWPGALGEDIIKRETVALAPFEYRFHPVFLTRHFWPRNPRDWHQHQRLYLYSSPFACGHAFTDWWDKYHETHPEYFALQPNGTRTPPKEGSTVKLCISNPGVWTQWLDNTEQKLRDNPYLRVISATPNDGPWHCTCTNCRAWDHPDAPQNVLTERHVKFWNILARGLRERFPDREVFVGAAAYAAYYLPPVAERLEKNIAIALVGHFPLTDEANRSEAKKDWSKWGAQATLMFYRPNLWYWAGGVWGLPEVAFDKTIEDFRFLADNKCIGIEVDVMRNQWATQGPQYYLMAQLTYDPYQDGAAVMKDYYRRAFGPAAGEMEQYWKLMEDACDAVMAEPDFKRGSQSRYKLPDIFARVYSEKWMEKVAALLKKAESRAAESDLYRRRVAYARAGFEYTRLLVGTVPLMTRVRESQARDVEAVRQAQDNWKAIEQVARQAEPWALGFDNLCAFIRGSGYQGGMQDYFGPPSEDLLNAQKQQIIRLRPAKWELAFADDFQRSDLGPDWQTIEGKWVVTNGCLVSNGEGTLVTARKFPGLQKITFNAVTEPNPGVSDMSPFIQAGTNGFGNGYMLQFGGNYNKGSAIHRKGKQVQESQQKIEPGRTYAMVAEYDGITVRLTVDSKVVAEYPEQYPLLGEGHEQIGFYVYEGKVKISNLKVYTSKAVKADDPVNGGEGEGFE